jgi:hypothetical protein
MLADDRITSFDWRRYNLYNAVFEPAQMTAGQLEDGMRQAYRWYYARNRRARRFLRETGRRDPRFNMALAAAASNYDKYYGRHAPRLHPGTAYEAAMEDVQRLARASAAPAQEALAVAYADATAGPGASAGSGGAGASAPAVTSVPVVLRTRPLPLPKPDPS